jgi:hypothetical protein
MKKYIKRVIETAEELGYNQAFKASVEHLKSQGFELVLKKDLKAQEKLNKLYKSQIADLVHDNWEIQMQLYEVRLTVKDRP